MRALNCVRRSLIVLNRTRLCSSNAPSTATANTDLNAVDKSKEHAGKSQEFDIVINGGGIVGFSLLAAISKSPFLREKRVLLLEQQPKKAQKNDSKKSESNGKPHPANQERKLSNRVSSLTVASKDFFDKLGLWSQIEPCSKEVRAMHVWSHDYNQGITFTPHYPGVLDTLLSTSSRSDSCVCYFLENHVLLNALEQSVPPNFVRYGSSVTDITANANKVNLLTDNGDTITANLLVGCDGFNSIVRRKSSLRFFEQKLNETGIVGTVQMLAESEDDANDVTFQRFLAEDGTVIGILPLTNTHSSFVISAPSKRADALMQLSDDDFVNEFNQLLTKESKRKPNPFNTIASLVDNAVNQALKSAGFKPGPPPKAHVPQITNVLPKSRAAFPLGFATTAPSLVGSPKGSNNRKIVIIGE